MPASTSSTFRQPASQEPHITTKLPAHDADCPECGLRVSLPKLKRGQKAACPRCGRHLVHIENQPFSTVFACASAALILMLLVYSQPFVTVQARSIYAPLSLPEMVYWLLADNWSFMALTMLFLTFGTPLLFLLLVLYSYFALSVRRNWPFVHGAVRMITRLRQWIMVDVFFISMLVAYIKIKEVAEVHFGAAFWLMPAWALLLLRTSLAVSEHWTYRQFVKIRKFPVFQAAENTVCCSHCLHFRPLTEIHCGVCGSELFQRRPHSLKISLYLLIAAALLYLPANLLPIMITENPVKTETSTILSGVVYMWHKGDKLVAAVIFSASVAVPVLKIISLSLLMLCTQYRLSADAHILSWQYRITEAIGRWSMIDIFVIIILMTSFHTPMARVTPGPAAVYFCLVVVLTMLSAYFFDPRMLWDKQNKETV